MKLTYNRSEIINIKHRLSSLIVKLQNSKQTTEVLELASKLEEQIFHYKYVINGLRKENEVITEYSLCKGFNETEYFLNQIERELR
ncbi:MAG: hypothetical protein ACE3L7_05655 [Candidatus Pristimantibacillus sp.]